MHDKSYVQIPCYGCSPIQSFECSYCNGTRVMTREWYYGMEGKIFRLGQNVTGRSWNGHKPRKHLWTPEFTPVKMKCGDLVKVVMCSRFGDVGITLDLEAEHGYVARVNPEILEVFDEG